MRAGIALLHGRGEDGAWLLACAVGASRDSCEGDISIFHVAMTQAMRSFALLVSAEY